MMRKHVCFVSLFAVGFLYAACIADDRAASQPSGQVVRATSQPAVAATDGPTSQPTAVAGDEPTSRRATQSADVATTKPTAGAAEPTTTITQAPVLLSSGDSKVDAILDGLEVTGQSIKGLACGLAYKYVTVIPVEDAQIKQGELLFARAEPNPKFLIHFTKLIADGTIVTNEEYFLFDGEWLTERKDRSKTIIKRQIVREGKRIDPFKLGSGPFPLPFGQKREEILRTFAVTLEAPVPGDPENTDHLHCVPLPRTELASKYSRVDIYVDKKIELPVRIVTERVTDRNRIEVDFKKIDANEAPAMSRFQLDEPRGFTVTIEPLPPLTRQGTGR